MATPLQRYAHPVLFVDEIIVEFLGHLHRPKYNTDIDAAGLTCKAWRDSSLAVKWQQVDLKRLLSVLAPLIKSDLEGPPATWSFAHVPTDRDHHRFHDLASRVHFLNDGGHLPLGESVFTTISNGFPGSTVLLPNLRSANFVADSRFDPTFVENLSRILAFYPSSLRHLALSVAPGSSESREKLLLNLASRFSRLSTIRLYRAALTQADARAMAKLIEHNPDLRRATIQQYITSAPVDALLNAPHLETLMIRTDRLNDSLDYRRCLRGGPFPQLKSLTIQLILDARVFDLLTNIGAHHSLQTLR
ncbi:hypothetical protein FRB95_003872, partial [Tulasnella sp. JGI-2019a]